MVLVCVLYHWVPRLYTFNVYTYVGFMGMVCKVNTTCILCTGILCVYSTVCRQATVYHLAWLYVFKKNLNVCVCVCVYVCVCLMFQLLRGDGARGLGILSSDFILFYFHSYEASGGKGGGKSHFFPNPSFGEFECAWMFDNRE